MVAIRLDLAAFGTPSAGPDDGKAGARLLHFDTGPSQLARNGINAIRFLHPKLAHVGKVGAPFGQGGGHGERRDLVDRAQRQIAVDACGLERPDVAHTHAAERLSHGFRGLHRLDRGAHQQKRIQDSGAGRIEPDALDGNITARDDGRGNQQKSRGRKVAGHLDGRRLQRAVPACGVDHHATSLGIRHQRCAEKPQDAFAVIARQTGLFDGSPSASLQAGQNESAFELSTGHRQDDVDSAQLAALDHERREKRVRSRGIGAAPDARTHLAQGSCNPPHRPTSQ